jgi:NAD(P)-dependent dehydrogenase (short-subunit alcohol dehydrogenase family)
MERFYDILTSPHQAFPGASSHGLHFSGLILAPDLAYPSGSVEALSPEVWSDALNSKVLSTISITNSFLPTIKEFQARVIVLTPNIVRSLNPAYHSVESTVVGALDGFSKTLDRELKTSDVAVCQIKLGTFDFSAFVSRSHYAQQHFLASRSTSKASNLRLLHHAVFDALTMKHPPRVRRVGRGSMVYDVVGSWTPAILVDWMLGTEKPAVPEVSRPLLDESSQVWEKVERSG